MADDCNSKCCEGGTPILAGDDLIKICYVDIATRCQKVGWKKIEQTDPNCPDQATELYMDLAMNPLNDGSYVVLDKCPDEINIAN